MVMRCGVTDTVCDPQPMSTFRSIGVTGVSKVGVMVLLGWVAGNMSWEAAKNLKGVAPSS